MKNVIPRSIEALDNIYGMRFLVRTEFNVPIVNGVVQSEYRILAAIPTILYLLERGARVIILTHVGRDPKNSTHPLLEMLNKYVPTTYVDQVIGDRAYGATMHMKEGTVVLLENLRSCDGEVNNDENFAKALASYGNFYVNEAFGNSHREHASIVTLPKLLPNFAGLTFFKEQQELRKAFSPEEPSLFILGGSKFETKEPLIDEYADKYSNVFVGGALANDFLKAKGHEVGKSLLSPTDLAGNPILDKENILLPSDVVVLADSESRQSDVDKVKPTETIVDAGKGSMEMLAPYIKKSKTILWNGPLGSYDAGFNAGTIECARLIAESDAHSVVGGGDTVAAIESLDLQDSFGFISTGGGAMLKFLENQSLPGIEALTDSNL